jgi:hypothetical protein
MVASGELADGYVNNSETAGGVAVALPGGATTSKTITLTLPGTGSGTAQTTGFRGA